ncbi:MAG: T9SS type A sorting domain-containing protein [Bacteroidetes bacterium]|nr:T9SS type A sorting domain-containing protein [Bacteroidota bacterium]MBL7105094.1 T9SS type A sorting domain-containing protein [Bacteroidales bacterium]
MKKIYLIFLAVFFVASAFSQQKPPGIENDYVTILAGDIIEVYVLRNDWCMEGHTMKIFYIIEGISGEVTNTDSTITYSSYYYFEGTDSIQYIIQDVDNGLLSEIGYLIITVENYGLQFLELNNIRALIQAFGLQFYKINDQQWFEVPKGSNKHTVSTYSLWIAGLDNNNELHLAAERYKQIGNDYWPGPVSDEYNNQQMVNWNKIWKISRDEIEYHKSHWHDTGYEPIEAIATWPAYGDVSAGQAAELAPFIDIDGNDYYDPLSGDFPAIKGDQGLFFIYNDDYDEHGESGGKKLGVEIQGMAYAFDCPDDSVFFNSIFFHYDIINRSDTAYFDSYVGAYVDFDLGNAWDDYIGCDTILNCCYIYNSDNYDENEIHPQDTSFGYLSKPPAQAFVWLNTPFSSFMYCNNSGWTFGDPHENWEYYNVLKAFWKDGTHLTYGGNGYGGSIPFNFVFPGDPNNPDEWSEISAQNEPFDRRGIPSHGPLTFHPGDTIKLDVAFVFARDYQGDNLTSVSLLKERVEQIRWFYDNDSTPCGASWSGVNNKSINHKELCLFPNPANNLLYFDGNINDVARFSVFDITGKQVMNGILNETEKTIPVGSLKSGFYIIKIHTDKNIYTAKFIRS